jgi:tryptophan synthase alpha chain
VTVPLGATLASHRDAGRKLLIAYVMAGSTPTWLDAVEAMVAAGADAIEVGLPFSDPIIDGPTIQAAATTALAAGTTFDSVVAELAARRLEVPLVAMTYANVVLSRGYDLAAHRLVGAGCSGAIIADLSLEELDEWAEAAATHGIETVLLAAPSTPPARLDAICARAQGFLYAVGRMATTGESASLDPRGIELVTALRPRTTLPICLGIGISSPRHAAEAYAVADGVVVGSAIVRRMLEGERPEALGGFVATLREGIDAQ